MSRFSVFKAFVQTLCACTEVAGCPACTQMVNMIFLLGQALEYNWGMWLQISLVFAALLSHYQQPYVLRADNRQEQMTFLGLSLVLTITNSGITYSGGWQWYHVCVVVFVVVLMTSTMCWNQLTAMRERTRLEERVARGEDDLTAFTRSVFASVVPSFLLLKDEQRERIRQLLQVSLHVAMRCLSRIDYLVVH
jgi:hypothetical protein|eukprot:COSAG06_NODE_2069_length_7674_cov_13.551815_2_plen_193_part_00